MNKSYDLSNHSVFIAIPAYRGYFPVETTLNLIELTGTLKGMGISTDLYVERENAIVNAARNSLVHHYLTESKADHLFFIDDDIIFPVDDFISVFALATEYGVVSATYPSRKDKPTFFMRNPHEGAWEVNGDGLVKTIGTGLGFTCIKREIVQSLYDESDWYIDHISGDKIKNIFRLEVKDGRFWGEDMSFFQDLYDRGHYNWVYPLTSLKHQGKKDFDYRLIDHMKGLTNG